MATMMRAAVPALADSRLAANRAGRVCDSMWVMLGEGGLNSMRGVAAILADGSFQAAVDELTGKPL